MRAARWMHVQPWDLEQAPIIWRERALTAESVEAEVRREAQKKAERASARKGH